MSANQNKRAPLTDAKLACGGFTLIELMIWICMFGILSTVLYATFKTSRQTAVTQRQVSDLQQQLRGSTYILGREIMVAGYDPTGGATSVNPAGILDIRRYGIAAGLAGLPNNSGSPVLTINHDLDADGSWEQSTILINDTDNDGVLDLAITTDGGATYDLLAEGIQAVGFAYAFDNDNDGNVELSANGNIIWAVDSDNDNDLDRSLDVDDDGDIDSADLSAASASLASDVPVGDIRMVRIWLLGRSIIEAHQKLIDSRTYIVGDREIPAANDTFRRRTLETIINCRNLG